MCAFVEQYPNCESLCIRFGVAESRRVKSSQRRVGRNKPEMASESIVDPPAVNVDADEDIRAGENIDVRSYVTREFVREDWEVKDRRQKGVPKSQVELDVGDMVARVLGDGMTEEERRKLEEEKRKKEEAKALAEERRIALERMKREEEAPPAEPTTKKCLHCLSEIPIKASRCGHCTSELPA